MGQVDELRRSLDNLESRAASMSQGQSWSRNSDWSRTAYRFNEVNRANWNSNWNQLWQGLNDLNREYSSAERSLENALRRAGTLQGISMNPSEFQQQNELRRDMEELAAELATLRGRRDALQMRIQSFR